MGYTPYCLAECRWIVEGKELIMGIPFTAIEGDEHYAKIEQVKKFGADELADFVEKYGFSMICDTNSFCVLPGNCIIINVITSDTSVHGLRWSIVGGPVMLQRSIDELMNLDFSYGSALGNIINDIINGFSNFVMEVTTQLWQDIHFGGSGVYGFLVG